MNLNLTASTDTNDDVNTHTWANIYPSDKLNFDLHYRNLKFNKKKPTLPGLYLFKLDNNLAIINLVVIYGGLVGFYGHIDDYEFMDDTYKNYSLHME